MIYPYTYGETLLQANHVSLTLGGNPILRDINFCIKDILRTGSISGQIVSILGPSGCGKTQLFKVISGLRPPTSGEVLLKGKPTNPGEVGVVPQNYPLFKHLTLKQNLELVAKDKVIMNTWLEEFDLIDKVSLYPAQLSGGQRQRVSILQQLLCSEHYLLLDEPFSGLDVVNEAKVMKTLITIANAHEQNTLIIITHDATAAALISDHIWIMGKERTQCGNIIPGTKILQEINLIDLGLAWQPDIEYTDKFIRFVRDIKKIFTELV